MSGAVEGVVLLACPFCGGEAASDVYAGTARDFYTIGCNNDLCAASCHFTGYEGLEPLIPLWNTRTTPPARSYADAIEDAAKAAEDWCCSKQAAGLANTTFSAINIAAAIRLLSQGEKA